MAVEAAGVLAKLGLGKLLGIIAALVVVGAAAAGAAYQYYNALSLGSTPPPLPNTGGVAIPQITAALKANQGNVFIAMANLSQQYINSIPQTTVAYSGNVKGQIGSGGLSFIATFGSPVIIRSAKYAGSNKFDFNLTDLAPFGNVHVVYANLTNGTFVCTNLNVSAIEGVDVAAMLGGGRNGTVCSRGNSVGGLNMTDVSNLQFTQIDQITNVNYTDYYQSQWDGMPCTFINGTITPLSQQENWTGTFQTCMSNNYWIPLTMYVYLRNPQGRGYISVNETSISSTANLTYINALP